MTKNLFLRNQGYRFFDPGLNQRPLILPSFIRSKSNDLAIKGECAFLQLLDDAVTLDHLIILEFIGT